MAKGKNIHVVPRNDCWVVRKEGNTRASSKHATQREAIKKARGMARGQSSELVIHRSDGRVSRRDSYSRDPLPPREPRKVLFPEGSGRTGKKAIRDAVRAVVRESQSHGHSRKTSRTESGG